MKNWILAILVAVIFLACAPQKPLYTWGNYEVSSYSYLRDADAETLEKLIASYEEIIANQKGTRGEVPPGIYADYGFILIQNGNTEKGKEMLNLEIANYPESEVFIARILKMLEE